VELVAEAVGYVAAIGSRWSLEVKRYGTSFGIEQMTA
jgi:hypothetical protein